MWTLEGRKSRPKPVIVTRRQIMATYTVDHDWLTPYELAGSNDYRTLALRGTVVALNPYTRKIVPNYASYGFSPLGVLPDDVDCGGPGNEHDVETAVLWRGVVTADRCWDNGIYGTVLETTKDALADRIIFVTSYESGRYHIRDGIER